jgi:hypothetical protein
VDLLQHLVDVDSHSWQISKRPQNLEISTS